MKTNDLINWALVAISCVLVMVYLGYSVFIKEPEGFSFSLIVIGVVTFTGVRLMIGAVRSSSPSGSASLNDVDTRKN
jgi:Na+/H+ antiporter NhaC